MPRAGLTPDAVTVAGAVLVDEIGFASLSMGLLADRLGVRPPALYKHVASLGDLAHRIATLGWTELAASIRDATAGRAGSDALTAGAQAMRTYVKEHPGRYDAANAAHPTGPDDPLITATTQMIDSTTAMLRGYDLDPGQEIHALRMLRSTLHGFTTFEATNGFQMDIDADTSFAWAITFIDRGLRSLQHSRDRAPATT